MRRHPVPYYEYHGQDTYYGLPFRHDRSSFHMSRRSKKTLTEKLSNKLDRLAKPKEKGYNRAYQEVYRDHFGNILLPRVGGGEPWPHHAPSPSPRRTFHNVIPRGRSSTQTTPWSGWDGGGGGGGGSGGGVYGQHPKQQQPGGGDQVMYGDVIYGDYQKFAINSNVCLCEDYLSGTNRSSTKKGLRHCKRCGFNRPASAEVYRSMRRSLSEESISGGNGGGGGGNQDPYEYMRKRRLVYPKPVFYDEQDEYEDMVFDDVGPELGSRKPPTTPNQPHHQSPKQDNSNKPFTRTQSMNLNNRNHTKDSKDMQNIAIRSSPLRSGRTTAEPGGQLVTGTVPTTVSPNRNIVTVNGCASKNSSIIYLSPDTSSSSSKPLASTDYIESSSSSITINTSTPSTAALVKPTHNNSSSSSAVVSPYELIKKYAGDSPPNSLSDSNLSSASDGGHMEKGYSKSDSDFSDSDSDDDDDVGRDAVVGRFNSFKISGQKIQIYSDSSVRQSGEFTSTEEEDSEVESEYSYDADCSVVESPRIYPRDPFRDLDEDESMPPKKPPRRKSAEKEILPKNDFLEILDLEMSSRSSQAVDPAGQPASGQSSARNSKVIVSRKVSTDSQRSVASRSKSFSGSRDSLFGSVDFKHCGISKNFSNEIIKELYGSKTSLLKNLEHENAKRRRSNPLEREFSSVREEPRLDNDDESSLAHDNEQLPPPVPQPVVDDPACDDEFPASPPPQEDEEPFIPISRQKMLEELCSGCDPEPENEQAEDNVDDDQPPAPEPAVVSRPQPAAVSGRVLLQELRADVPQHREVLLQDLRRQQDQQLRQSSEQLTATQRPMFQDTTRLRQISRPSIKDALQNFSAAGTKLGRLGISQSFRERLIPMPVRPQEPPPPPPAEGEGEVPPPPPPPRSLAKKLFSFNKSEMRKLNKFLGIRKEEQEEEDIYDVANDDASSVSKVKIVENSRFYTNTASVEDVPLRLKSGDNPGGGWKDYVKPSSRPKRERSKSFTPRSRPLHKALIFNRSLSQLSKSSSSNAVHRSESCRKFSASTPTADTDVSKRTLSSSDLVHIFPDDERRGFKDIRKILSSPSISSPNGSTSSGIYRPKSQLSNSSSVINAIKEEQTEQINVREIFTEHIYEEINEKDIDTKPVAASKQRPLPPIPGESAATPTNRASPLTSEQSSPVKSIFEGASKYDILNYLEDARERGLTDCDLDLDEDEDDDPIVEQPELVIGSHKLPKSGMSSSRSASSSEEHLAALGDKLGSVDIERNDSGLGSERGVGRREGGKVIVRKRHEEPDVDTLCIDCDQIIENPQSDSDGLNDSPLCETCSSRRIERKEIITEIIETEIKYGRDLGIIIDQFYKPMQVAGLLTAEQLANVFLNVEELLQVNERFTECLKDAIEIALDQGDEDLSTVSIGKLFIQASYMLGAFKSYCTRQGSASALLGSLEREKELLRIFLRVSQMENTILRRMNLSSFLMVPVQRVTRYPLLVSRLMTVTPGHHGDRVHLQQARETIEQSLESMNQETNRENSSTKLWRRISIMNPPARRSENQIDLLGSTTWGVRKMVLETLGWGRESREDINFVLEGRLLYTQSTETNWRNLFSVKMVPINIILVSLGQQNKSSSSNMSSSPPWREQPVFPRESQCREAALILLKEKGLRYTPVREPLLLDRCIICWEQEWEDCFEITEFTTKESFIFKGEDVRQTTSWFQALQFFCLSLGAWRRRRNGLANIMINGMVTRDEEVHN